MRRMIHLFTGISLASALALASGSARALDPEAESRAHYERAVKLYAEGAYEASLAEMIRVRELNQSYKILFNIAQVRTAMNDFVGAISGYRQYLQEGGAELSAPRRDAVQKEITALEARVASVRVHSDVPGAEALVDGQKQGVTPLTLTLNPGLHEISVRHGDDGTSKTQNIVLAEGAHEQLSFTLLVEPLATLGSRERPASLPARPRSAMASAREPLDSQPHTEPPRYAAWAVVGGLAALAAPAGVLALSSQHSDATRARVFAGVCDGLLLGAAGLGLWLALDPSAFRGGRAARSGALVLRASTSELSVAGRF